MQDKKRHSPVQYVEAEAHALCDYDDGDVDPEDLGFLDTVCFSYLLYSTRDGAPSVRSSN